MSEMSEHERTGWRLHGELVERSNRQRLHDMSVIDELKSLLRRACGADAREDCHYDHNGGCQAHGFLSEPCPYPLIRQYLATPDPSPAALDGLVEEGRRLASKREDLIAAGVDPATLAIPLNLATPDAPPSVERGES